MIVEYYVTGTVTAGTNVPSLALLNCIASGLTAGRIAYNSPSNKIISSVMPGGTFFLALAVHCSLCSPAAGASCIEAGNVKWGTWKWLSGNTGMNT